MKSHLVFILFFIFFFSCSSDKKASVSITKIEGIDSESLLGGVALYATDGVERFAYTFATGRDLENSKIQLPGDKRWLLRAYAWEGNDSPDPNKNFQGRIRCGEKEILTESGVEQNVNIDLTNNNCFQKALKVDSLSTEMAGLGGSPNRAFYPITLFNCKNLSGINSFNDFNSSHPCHTEQGGLPLQLGPTTAYRVVIRSINPQPEIGLLVLASKCIEAPIHSATNAGILLEGLNLPPGYLPKNEIPRSFSFGIEAYSDYNCTKLKKVLFFKNGIADTSSQQNLPGNIPLRSVSKVQGISSGTDFVFSDIQLGEVPSLTVETPLAHNDYINSHNQNAFIFEGDCSPDGSSINFAYDYESFFEENVATCNSGEYSFSIDLSSVVTSQLTLDNISQNRFEIEVVAPNGNINKKFIFLGRDTIAPYIISIGGGGGGTCGTSPHTFNINFSEALSITDLLPYIALNLSSGGVASNLITTIVTSQQAWNLQFDYTSSGGENINLNFLSNSNINDYAGNQADPYSDFCSIP